MDQTAFAPLAASLCRAVPLEPASLEALRGITQMRTFEAEAFLLRGGEQARLCYWIASGLVREFYIGEGGTEHIRRFMGAGEITGSLLDLLSGKPAVTFIQALEPVRSLCWELAAFDQLCAKYADLQLLARRLIERLYLCKAQREHDMLALSARERLACWQREEAQLDGRVSRRHLASYLGITPEHLSRLRRGSAT